MGYLETYNLWLNNVKDEKLKQELLSMTEEEKSTAFFKEIEFGTAGLRGTVGAGSNCMNIYTVGRATRAVCEYLKKNGGKSLAVSYDSRIMSLEFARLVAGICVNYGIKVYLADKLMPTPYLSYMVRYYGADMGVMITASHNPKAYNGYKVYGNDGCQLLDEPSLEIMKIAESLDLFDLQFADYEESLNSGKIVLTDDVILESYKKEVKKQSKARIENIKVVFSALNGTGINTLPVVLKECGAEILYNEIQCVPDENFTTCPSPNPEKLEVFETSLPIAREKNADLIILSDPDADRVGVEVLSNGEYVHLSGNEAGVLMADYLFKTRDIKNGVIVKSIVSTGLADKLAEKQGVRCKNVLTGFKYIGEYIKRLENENREDEFILGFEESYGYLVGTHVRDKDATVASLVITEMASEYKKQGFTLIDRLNEIYNEFGYYEHLVFSYKFAGSEGADKMKSILSNLRDDAPVDFGGIKVKNSLDYKKGVEDLPKADVLVYNLEGGSQVVVRPSGTEPLIKIYITLSKTKEENAQNLKLIKESVEKILA